jgi:probable phosphoglycerate mutase
MTELILIRHGQTELNRGPFFQGQIDVPLNALGHAQAARLADRLAAERPDAIHCSDLLRTRQTAGPAARVLALSAVPDPALREQHFGVLEGLSFDEARRLHPQAWEDWLRHDPECGVPGGECARAFRTRVMGALHALARTHAGGRLAVVTHGGVLDMVWRTARALPLAGARTCAIPNAALNRVRIGEGTLEILAWADDAHVADLAPPATPVPQTDAAESLRAPPASAPGPQTR